jgi:hypothetical protein
MSDKALVFISCGQFTDDEKQLGKAVCELVNATPGLQGYFAEDQSSPEGLSKHIFRALERAAGFIAIMHPRGEVATPAGTRVRASVWIEQEIAIVGYIQATRGEGGPKVAAYARKGIHREGVRDTIILNPKEFETNDDVLDDLKTKLASWTLQPRRSKEPKVSIDLGYTTDGVGNGEVHTYKANIVMKNESAVAISDYLAELRFPTWFVAPYVIIASEVRDLQTATYRVFQHENNTGRALLPGDSRPILGITYQVTTDLYSKYWNRPEFQTSVMVRVFVGDHLAGEASKPFRDLQNF